MPLKTDFLASVCFCLISSVVIFTFAENLMGLFIDAGEQQIIAEGARYLRIEGAMYVGIGVLFLWYGYFRGICKPHLPDPYHHFSGNPGCPVLFAGTPYVSGRGSHLVLHSDWMVPGRYSRTDFLSAEYIASKKQKTSGLFGSEVFGM